MSRERLLETAIRAASIFGNPVAARALKRELRKLRKTREGRDGQLSLGLDCAPPWEPDVSKGGPGGAP